MHVKGGKSGNGLSHTDTYTRIHKYTGVTGVKDRSGNSIYSSGSSRPSSNRYFSLSRFSMWRGGCVRNRRRRPTPHGEIFNNPGRF